MLIIPQKFGVHIAFAIFWQAEAQKPDDDIAAMADVANAVLLSESKRQSSELPYIFSLEILVWKITVCKS
jgi:hypothetical protein